MTGLYPQFQPLYVERGQHSVSLETIWRALLRDSHEGSIAPLSCALDVIAGHEGLRRFLKVALRSFRLRCISAEQQP